MTTHTLVINRGFPRFAVIALFCGAVAIAFSPILVRLSEVGPTATAFWRLALALPFMWAWLTFEKKTPPAQPRAAYRADYLWLLAAGICFAGDLVTWHWSLKFTSIANSVLLANSAPVFVTLGSWLFFRQRATSTFILGLLVALIGATTLIGASFGLSMQHFFGDTLALITAIFYGAYILCVKRVRDTFSTSTVMLWVASIAAIPLFPIALTSDQILLPLTLFGWMILISLALVAQVGGQSLITYALAHLPAAFSSVSLLIQPVLSTLFAWIILNETLGPRQALGGVIVLGGIYIARRGSS